MKTSVPLFPGHSKPSCGRIKTAAVTSECNLLKFLNNLKIALINLEYNNKIFLTLQNVLTVINLNPNDEKEDKIGPGLSCH